MSLQRAYTTFGALLVLLGLAHPTHLIIIFFRYHEATDNVGVLILGWIYTSIIAGAILLSGVLVARKQKVVLALWVAWIYAIMISMGMTIAAVLRAYADHLLILVMQLGLAALAYTIAIGLSRLSFVRTNASVRSIPEQH